MKFIKLYDSANQAINTTEETPLVACVKNVDKVMFASDNKFGSNVQIVADGPDFIKGFMQDKIMVKRAYTDGDTFSMIEDYEFGTHLSFNATSGIEYLAMNASDWNSVRLIFHADEEMSEEQLEYYESAGNGYYKMKISDMYNIEEMFEDSWFGALFGMKTSLTNLNIQEQYLINFAFIIADFVDQMREALLDIPYIEFKGKRFELTSNVDNENSTYSLF